MLLRCRVVLKDLGMRKVSEFDGNLTSSSAPRLFAKRDFCLSCLLAFVMFSQGHAAVKETGMLIPFKRQP